MFFHSKELSPEYKAYIQSDLWQSQRFEALRFYGYICPGCSARDGLHVHHLRYGNFIDIQPARDLIPLCPHCHEVVHNSDTLRSKLKECRSIDEKRNVLMKHLNVNPYHSKEFREAGRTRALYEERMMKIKPQFRLKPPKHKKQKEQNNQMPLPDHGLVIVTQQNKKWLRMSKESYHWMISVGIDPTKKKWNRRMIGREVPAKWFR